MPPPDTQHVLEEKIANATSDQLAEYVDRLQPGDAARAVSRLTEDEQSQLLTKLTPEEAADLLDDLPDAQAAGMVENLPASQAAAIVAELPSDEQADLVQDLSDSTSAAILSQMPSEEAARLRKLIRYADDVAGGLMVTELLSYPDTATVADVVDDLRQNVEKYRDYEVQYAYVVNAERQLRGVLRLRDLLLALPHESINRVMIGRPMNVGDQSSLEALNDFFDTHPYTAVPVTNKRHRLVGVVRRSSVEEALGEKSESDFRRSQGIVQEELRTMPLLTRSRRRLAWLSVNIVLNIMAAERHRGLSRRACSSDRARRVHPDYLRHERMLGKPSGGGEHA